MGLVETTGGIKPRRKQKSHNPAMALVETSGLKVVIMFIVASRGYFECCNKPKATLSVWFGCPLILRGQRLWDSRGQGETRQFKADRFLTRATHCSNS